MAELEPTKRVKQTIATYQGHVGHDGPVQIEEKLTEEDDGEAADSVPLGQKEAGQHERRRQHHSSTTNQRIRARKPQPKLLAQKRAERHAQQTGQHGDQAENVRDTGQKQKTVSDNHKTLEHGATNKQRTTGTRQQDETPLQRNKTPTTGTSSQRSTKPGTRSNVVQFTNKMSPTRAQFKLRNHWAKKRTVNG